MKKRTAKPEIILVRPRIQVGDVMSIGPGKIDLLRQLGQTQSISAAARALGIPYKRAWSLIDTLTQGFGRPIVETISGGKGGGGTTLTPLGQRLVDCYDTLQQRLSAEAHPELEEIRSLVSGR